MVHTGSSAMQIKESAKVSISKILYLELDLLYGTILFAA